MEDKYQEALDKAIKQFEIDLREDCNNEWLKNEIEDLKALKKELEKTKNEICKKCKNAHFYEKNTTEIKGNTTIVFDKGSMKCSAHGLQMITQNGEITYCSKFEHKEVEE